MPGMRKPELLQRVIQAIRASGWDSIVLSSDHPFRLSLFSGDARYLIRVYIWTLTHGGATRDENELRIQVKGISRFQLAEGEKTLVLGWGEQERMFAGFDVTKHRIDMTDRSPSFQIRRPTINTARGAGFATQIRGNEEIVIGFRPDFFATYVQELERLHEAAENAADLQTLQTIAQEPVEDEVRDIPAGPRRTVLQQIQRKVRDTRFRSNVMAAYQHRCAVSGIQLDLLDAAHIIPVEHERGTDETRNGICLTAIHHRAFDQGLIGIRRDYRLIVNERRLGELHTLGWDGGTDLFRQTLRDHIILPPRAQFYPDPEYLVFGQILRGWRESQLR